MNYYYGMRIRGCSPGAQPKGFSQRINATGNMKEYYGILEYPFPLDESETEHYSFDYLGCGNTLEEAQGKMLGACRREYGYGCIPFVIIILILLCCKLLPERKHEIGCLG